VEEQVLLAEAVEGKAKILDSYPPRIIKHSKIQYKAGKFLVQGDKPSVRKKPKEP
jgi:hypothetical protein